MLVLCWASVADLLNASTRYFAQLLLTMERVSHISAISGQFGRQFAITAPYPRRTYTCVEAVLRTRLARTEAVRGSRRQNIMPPAPTPTFDYLDSFNK
jgi:hypothetical protein